VEVRRFSTGLAAGLLLIYFFSLVQKRAGGRREIRLFGMENI
jgi:hypothetical protein